MKTKLNPEKIIELYQSGQSPYEIAEKYNTYANAIKRLLKKHKVKLRSRSEAQALALKTGRHQHPTEGKTRREDVKIKISKSMSEYNLNLTEQEKEDRQKRALKVWNKRSKEEKEEFKRMGTKAIRETRVEGSKLEKFVYEFLIEEGYNPVFHDDQILPTRDLQVDISIPAKMVCIEIDGPSHFKPIWSQEKLDKQKKFDRDKNALLISKGFTVIRIGYEDKVSLAQKDDLKKELKKVLKNYKSGQIVRIKI